MVVINTKDGEALILPTPKQEQTVSATEYERKLKKADSRIPPEALILPSDLRILLAESLAKCS